ncbi:MAG TPA: iron-sulfur cluster assembly accessory protein [Dehalococcoidia bacterium]|nr:iron-sulfur cluster assembly accessory protein [Dehalococcoidia bacterium]
MTVSPINFTFEEEVSAPETGAMVSITDRAAEKAKSLLETRGLSTGALRVFVVGGGCSGYQYGMALAQEEEEGDLLIEDSGVRILVDADSAPLLHGAEIDYVDDLMKSGFTIFNPQATKSCACGSSFQTADGSGQARACH